MSKAKSRTKKFAATSVRVTLPVSVACDLDRFEIALANVAVLVGSSHSLCTSQSRSRTREFVVDRASLEVKEAALECNEAP
jgi:hypothetical protein